MISQRCSTSSFLKVYLYVFSDKVWPLIQINLEAWWTHSFFESEKYQRVQNEQPFWIGFFCYLSMAGIFHVPFLYAHF